MISATGIIIRTPLDTISLQGRAAQGVTLMNLKPGDKVAAVALLDGEDEGDNGGEEAVAPAAGELGKKVPAKAAKKDGEGVKGKK